MEELMLNVFTKLFNKTEDELGAILYEGEGDERKLKESAINDVLALDESRIKRIKEDVSGDATKKFDDFAKKTKREIMTKFENDFKDSTGFDSDLTGVDLVKAWGETLGKETKVSAENLKTHPEFLKIENAWKEAHNEELNKVKGEFEEYKSSIAREQTMGKIKDMAETEFLKMNPVLSDDPAKKKAQTNMFLNLLDNYNYDFAEDGSVVIKEGDKRMEDGHGNRVGFPTFVKSEAEKLFDFQVQSEKGSAGNKTAGVATSKTVLSKKEYNDKANQLYADGDREAIKTFLENYSVAE